MSYLKLTDIKSDEIRGGVATESQGVRAQSIRKRGYYRALKRGENWALVRKAMEEFSSTLSHQMFYSDIFKQPYSSNYDCINGLSKWIKSAGE